MSLYQQSVLKKYLATQDKDQVKAGYKAYSAYFLNKEIQENIRNAKEEQFQQKFLMELFVNIFGYVMNPDAGFNLTTELKNIKDAKKTDGAILNANGAALAVIELKGTDTKDLDKVNDQAFNYKNNQPDCVYVITSNFEKLRFYIHNAVEHEEFNLFALSEERFALMWLFLQKENLLSGIPAKVKDESLLQEDKITKELYADYSAFKNALWTDMVQQNPQHDPLLLYKKSQKLLDRFLFIFFAEDKGLLPPNSILRVIERWEVLKEEDAYKPIYDIFKQYFGYMDTGRKGKKPADDIAPYNGGLFKADELLDGLLMDDELLKKHCLKLTNYDFADEVDTNILGHIFEHSLNDIENVRAQLAGEEVDKSKTKRKKDGVFYTPKYITKYIVDNTVGKLCEEKKAELGIDDEEFAKDRKGRKKETIKKLDALLKQYRAWLLELTICDPACGSGAFLNQALEFLMAEHHYVDELEAALFEGSIVFQNVENHILENNIYGVDINEESVEIARLSLWLRTAKKGRKLTSLSSNIKCGNSLIDDTEVAGDLAFNWQNEFQKVFEKGGFDVVIGNPPYVSSKGENFEDGIKAFLTRLYNTAAYQIDLYILFMERGLSLQKEEGVTSFIVPNSWLNNLFLEPVRKYLLGNSSFHEIVSMPSGTFESANVDTVIVTYTRKLVQRTVRLVHCANSAFHISGEADKNQWLESKGTVINIYLDKVSAKILAQLEKSSVTLGSFTEIARGVGVYHKRVGHTKELIAEDPYQSAVKKDESFVPYLRGRNLAPWLLSWNNDSFISYGKWLAEPRESKYFDGERIVLRQIPAKRLVATFLESQFITDQSVFIAKFHASSQFSPKSVLCIINSELMSYYFRLKYSEFDDLFPKVKLQHFKDFPIAKGVASIDSDLTEIGNKRLNLAQTTSAISFDLISLLQSKFDLPKPSTKLKNWPSLDFKGFLAELKKAKVELSLEDETEWMQYFNKKKTEANSLQSEIHRIDKEIDQMVYALYGLTPEEIAIVENS
jgi:type I restriction-modification system DNA methylase subunit